MLSVAGLLMKFHSDKQIRVWCKRRGIWIGERGRIPKFLRDGFMKWQMLESLKRRQ